jgi:benzoyl-CoA 2,3-dioxygenase component A
LDFGQLPFPVLEGQSIGIAVPGLDANGKPHHPRLYSVASSRDGEKRNANNLALTVKREEKGVCPNYLCDLPRGAKLGVTGPFGATFLMPDDPAANIIMICTRTGSAPFRGFTERRRRAMPDAAGRLFLFFGARRPEDLPYFGPLQKAPEKLLGKYVCYSRVPGKPRVYVQDRIRTEASVVAGLLNDEHTTSIFAASKVWKAA